MKILATTWTLVLLALLAVPTLHAQTVTTVGEINAVSQSGIDAVNALGANVTTNDISANIRSAFEGETVQFTAVVISDPTYSGLSSVNSSTNEPSRVHYFVRDITAATAGPAGQDIQVVDGNYRSTGSLNLFVGDVVRYTGTIAYFGTGMQFSPSNVEFQGTYSDLSLDASILDPVTITLDQLNTPTGDDTVRANWDNFAAMNQQYVRIENLQIYQSPNRTADRPNWGMRDTQSGAVIDTDDISLAYRNDRSDYPSDFSAENDFLAPPTGARVNIQGFALLARSTFDPFNMGNPSGAFMRLVPWTDSDLAITQSPPDVTEVQLAGGGVPGNNPVTITASIAVDPSRILTSTTLAYGTSTGATGTVDGTGADGSYSYQIPAQADRAFVNYTITATDSEGSTFETSERSFRVLFDGLTDIRDIQEPAPGSGDASPFAGLTLNMDLEVTVMTDPAIANGSSDIMTVQDGNSPWSGISLRASDNPLTVAGVAKGDRIRITSATVQENFGFTLLRDYTFEPVASPGSPYADIVVTTAQLQDSDIAESLESMYVRMENVVVLSTNADAPSGPFGEFLVSNGTDDDGVRVDDQSDLRSFEGNDPASVYSVGQQLAFVRGPLWYSFSNFKVQPETTDDIGPVTNVAVEDDVQPRTTQLHQNFPNPFNPTTSIRFDVATTGTVSLQVVDMLGRVVNTLVNEQRTAGTYTVQFNASQLASGLYLYRLQTADATVTRTMTLLK